MLVRYSRENTLTFFDRPKNVKGFLLVFYLSLVALLIYDFFVHKHDHIHMGNAPEFYAVYGFVSCVALIFIAKVLRLAIKRNEDYYEKK
ncbi:MAG: hypothetical protein KKD44_20830 [Proteobacteria bacterium]|nr:hypothetical protein [Pseudomonadota bacterium]